MLKCINDYVYINFDLWYSRLGRINVRFVILGD